MARGRDLAGLAALAGLAYMANRKNKEEPQNLGADSGAAMGATPSEDAGSFGYGDAGAAVDAAAMAEMGPRGSRAKVSPDTGELYYPEGAPTPARAPARSAAKAPARPNIVSREEGMKSYVPRRTPTREEFKKSVIEYVGRTSNAKAQAPAQAPARPSAAEQKYSADPDATIGKFVPGIGYVDVNGNIMSRNRQYKKGGVVKKMASGGVTSASKRADGIASRGKTKCKMY